jgi:hypothetical protein
MVKLKSNKFTSNAIVKIYIYIYIYIYIGGGSPPPSRLNGGWLYLATWGWPNHPNRLWGVAKRVAKWPMGWFGHPQVFFFKRKNCFNFCRGNLGTFVPKNPRVPHMGLCP